LPIASPKWQESSRSSSVCGPERYVAMHTRGRDIDPWLVPLVIVAIVNKHCICAFERKDQTPALVDPWRSTENSGKNMVTMRITLLDSATIKA